MRIRTWWLSACVASAMVGGLASTASAQTYRLTDGRYAMLQPTPAEAPADADAPPAPQTMASPQAAAPAGVAPAPTYWQATPAAAYVGSPSCGAPAPAPGCAGPIGCASPYGMGGAYGQGGCGAAGCGSQGCNSCCDLGDPWELCERTCRGWKVGGWLQGGIYANGHGLRAVNGNSPLGFNNISDGFNLHQAWVYLDKELANGDGLDWGMHIDYIFGVDGPDTASFGDGSWDNSWVAGGRGQYGSAIPQAYLQVGTPELNVKVGKFFTIIGYEVVQAPDNFFYSHHYTFYYGEPFTHTGVLGEYNPSDDLTFWAGYTFGWDSGFENKIGASTFLGGVSANVTDRLNLIYTTTFGEFGNGGVPAGDWNAGQIWMQSFIADYAVTDRLNYVFQSDFGVNTDTTPGQVAGGGTNRWYNFNNYLFYTINDCWRVGARYEWFYDDASDNLANRSRIGFGENKYQAITAGVNYRPHANVVFRPEVRWDWVENDPVFEDRGAGPLSRSQFTYGFDGIFTF